MLAIMFQVGSNRCSLDARDVLEVLPLLPLETWPGWPPSVVGLLLYRGEPAPVVDLAQLASGVPCPKLWGTRIIMVRRSGREECVGLLVDRVSTVQLPDASGGPGERMGEWGRFATDEQGLFQRIDVGRLLSAVFPGGAP